MVELHHVFGRLGQLCHSHLSKLMQDYSDPSRHEQICLEVDILEVILVKLRENGGEIFPSRDIVAHELRRQVEITGSRVLKVCSVCVVIVVDDTKRLSKSASRPESDPEQGSCKFNLPSGIPQ